MVLGLLACLGLGGCGFTPLYGNGSGPAGIAGVGNVSAELERVYVARIGGVYGEQVRLALQADMSGAGPEHPDGYTLSVLPNVSEESIDIHPDNTSGRQRITASAHWKLYTVEQYPKLLAEGAASTMDGYENTYEQYFAQTMNGETARGRVAKTLADAVTQQVSIWFRTHARPVTEADDHTPTYADPTAMPNSSNTIPTHKAGADGFPSMAIGRETPNADDSGD
ncbi:hypothetical protein AA103196_2805 [Ameyamaea chiangmaiensis NBRC 103196]|uniref:Lipoprotein n=2 Tax=Ameyamaea chiangmaiensis TaxID=442969 RepID=A0A850PDF3_9PROT|nr:hypothetical protein [Ameyamaea chiangmaiensis]NVN40709.1 hypothetical protein [Ameyamaea chiangmaiensis]GBQ71543.1 hypothetical protein AA103196_2805 [Ameyamaea chiangmaiensis NBRC 103196]